MSEWPVVVKGHTVFTFARLLISKFTLACTSIQQDDHTAVTLVMLMLLVTQKGPPSLWS